MLPFIEEEYLLIRASFYYSLVVCYLLFMLSATLGELKRFRFLGHDSYLSFSSEAARPILPWLDNIWRHLTALDPCSPLAFIFRITWQWLHLFRSLDRLRDYHVISTDQHRDLYMPGDIDEEGPPCSCVKATIRY